MTYYLWVGTGSGQNLGTLSNWRLSNSSHANVGPATQLPQAGDTCFLMIGNSIGTSGSFVTGTCPATISSLGSQIYGGTYTGLVNAGGSIISGCTFNGPVINANAAYTDTCNFNSSVTLDLSNGFPTNCTYNDNVTFVDSGSSWTAGPLYVATSPAFAAAAAAQLATDQAAVTVAAGNILNTATILGQGGIFNLAADRLANYAAGAASQKIADREARATS